MGVDRARSLLMLLLAVLVITTACSETPTPTPMPLSPSVTATPVAPSVTPLAATATPILPTATPVVPTATQVPPTATPVPPTATPIPPTATPLAATPTRLLPTAGPATVVPTPQAATEICTLLPIRGFGCVWATHPEVVSFIGCSYGTQEKAMRFVVQQFEHGYILWMGGPDFPSYEKYAWVFYADDNTYAKVAWTAAEPTANSQRPSSKPFEPVGALSKVWKEAPRAKDRLGLAVEPEKGGTGAWQQFSRGWMFWIPFKQGTPDDQQTKDLELRGQKIFVVSTATPPPVWGARNQWQIYTDRYISETGDCK